MFRLYIGLSWNVNLLICLDLTDELDLGYYLDEERILLLGFGGIFGGIGDRCML